VALEVSCTQCGKNYQNVKLELAGKLVRCKCGNQIQVPESVPDLTMPEDLAVDDLPPLGSTGPAPGTYWTPPAVPSPQRGPSSPNPVRQNVANESRRDSFRTVDIIYIVVGVLVALSGLGSLLGVFYSALSLLSTSSIYERAGVEISSSLQTALLAMAICRILSYIARVILGACGAGMIAYVYEKRTKGKSSFQWTLLAGAIAGGACIAISLMNVIVRFMVLSSLDYFPVTGLSFVSSIFGLAFGSILPVAMIALYVDRKKLKYSELG
jgi:hypothetical protein